MTTRPTGTADLLATIVAATRRIVEVREAREPAAALAAAVERLPTTANRFREALLESAAAPRIIAECKRRSPSRGVLRAAYDPVAIARGYEVAGAAAISVLTEPTFFDGSLDHLRAVRKAVRVPLLRKDFVISEYQLLEARSAGADAVLLIVAALEPGDFARLHARATELGLDVLVEVHTLDELSAAVDRGAGIIGVNNRNLRSLEVDVRVSEAVMERMPRDIVAVSESGLKTAEDVARLRRLGYNAFLVGERFMTAEDPGAALKALLDESSTTLDVSSTTKDTKDTEVQKGSGLKR
jgi:indole-3-glycerol phosphate synthase